MMCQHFEAEQRSIFKGERQERRRKLELHQSGEQPLTDDEIRNLMVEELMARDAGF